MRIDTDLVNTHDKRWALAPDAVIPFRGDTSI
jgi:hypothetical protein